MMILLLLCKLSYPKTSSMEIIRSSSWAEVLFEGGERTTVRISVRETDNNVLTYHKIDSVLP